MVLRVKKRLTIAEKKRISTRVGKLLFRRPKPGDPRLIKFREFKRSLAKL